MLNEILDSNLSKEEHQEGKASLQKGQHESSAAGYDLYHSSYNSSIFALDTEQNHER